MRFVIAKIVGGAEGKKKYARPVDVLSEKVVLAPTKTPNNKFKLTMPSRSLKVKS